MSEIPKPAFRPEEKTQPNRLQRIFDYFTALMPSEGRERSDIGIPPELSDVSPEDMIVTLPSEGNPRPAELSATDNSTTENHPPKKSLESSTLSLSAREEKQVEKFLQELTGSEAVNGAEALQLLDQTVRWLNELQRQTATDDEPEVGIDVLHKLIRSLITTERHAVKTEVLSSSDPGALRKTAIVAVSAHSFLSSMSSFSRALSDRAILQLRLEDNNGNPTLRIALANNSENEGKTLNTNVHLLEEIQLLLRYANEKKAEQPRYRVLLTVRNALEGMQISQDQLSIGTLEDFLWIIRSSGSERGSGKEADNLAQQIDSYITGLEALFSMAKATKSKRNDRIVSSTIIQAMERQIALIQAAYKATNPNSLQKAIMYIWTVCDPQGSLRIESRQQTNGVETITTFLNASKNLVQSWRAVIAQEKQRERADSRARAETELGRVWEDTQTAVA